MIVGSRSETLGRFQHMVDLRILEDGSLGFAGSRSGQADTEHAGGYVNVYPPCPVLAVGCRAGCIPLQSLPYGGQHRAGCAIGARYLRHKARLSVHLASHRG